MFRHSKSCSTNRCFNYSLSLPLSLPLLLMSVRRVTVLSNLAFAVCSATIGSKWSCSTTTQFGMHDTCNLSLPLSTSALAFCPVSPKFSVLDKLFDSAFPSNFEVNKNITSCFASAAYGSNPELFWPIRDISRQSESTQHAVIIKKILELQGVVIILNASSQLRPETGSLIPVVPNARVLENGFTVACDSATGIHVLSTSGCGSSTLMGTSNSFQRMAIKSNLILPLTLHSRSLLYVVNSRWSYGYYHFLSEVLPRLNLLTSLKPQLARVTIVLPKAIENWAFHREALCYMGLSTTEVLYLGENEAVQADLAMIPEVSNCNASHVSSLRRAVDTLKKRILLGAKCDLSGRVSVKQAITPEPDLGKVYAVFITHRDADKRRKILNLNRLLDVIRINFPRLQLVEYDGAFNLKETASLFGHADLVIAPHGAGLTNLIFARRATRVLEFVEPTTNHRFEKLCNAFEMEYHRLITPIKNGDFLVDIGSVQVKLAELVPRGTDFSNTESTIFM